MGKKRAYSAKPSITSRDLCRASLPGLDLLLSVGAASHRPHARSLRPNATQAIGPNPVPTRTLYEHPPLPPTLIVSNYLSASSKCVHVYHLFSHLSASFRRVYLYRLSSHLLVAVAHQLPSPVLAAVRASPVRAMN